MEAEQVPSRKSRIALVLGNVLVALFLPWRIGARIEAQPSGFRLPGPWAWAGVLILPCVLGGLLLQGVPERTDLSPPQAGLMAALSEGLVHAAMPPLAELLPALLLRIVCWIGLGLLAGVIGAAFLSGLSLLAALVQGQRGSDLRALWRRASYSLLLAPLGAAALALGVALYADSAVLGQVSSTIRLAVVALLALWFIGGTTLAAVATVAPVGRIGPGRRIAAGLLVAAGSMTVLQVMSFVAFGLLRLLFPSPPVAVPLQGI